MQVLREVVGTQQGSKQRTLPLRASSVAWTDIRDTHIDTQEQHVLVSALEEILQRAPGSGKPLTPIPQDHIGRKHQKILEHPCSLMKQQTTSVKGATQLCTRAASLAIAEEEAGGEAWTRISLDHSKDLP